MPDIEHPAEHQPRIVLPGGAGLVGQNLALRLHAAGYENLVVLDKHAANVAVMRRLLPDVEIRETDLAEAGDWQDTFAGADAVVMLQAQIGALDAEPFRRNNLTSTRYVLDAMQRHQVPYLVHISSSVVESVANDYYTETKTQQEELVRQSGIAHVTLRPTLMFGWFDRKHLGWLARFMNRVPVFPIPGWGRYPRQPLFVGDFCAIIERCLADQRTRGSFNISGLEYIDYVDMIRAIRRVTGSKTPLLNIPLSFFRTLLRMWALFDRNPPFTADQLDALVAEDEFEIIDWPSIFGVIPTPFEKALRITFEHPQYSAVKLDF